MTVYYTLLIVLLYLGLVKFCTRGSKEVESFLVMAGIILLFLIAALRGVRVGADTNSYCRYYLGIMRTRWSDLAAFRDGTLELGYKFYNKILSSVFQNRQTITISNSFLQMLFISILIFRESKDRYLSLLFYFTFCFYQTALNLSPSSYVSYFMLLSLPLIQKKRLIPFLLWSIIGSLFHLSVLFFLPLYFICRMSPKRRNVLIFLGIGVISFVFFTFLLPALARILPSSYRGYVQSAGRSYDLEQILVYLVQLLAVCFIWILMNAKERRLFVKKYPVVFWMFLLETVVYLLSIKSRIFARGAFLYSPYIIILLPQMIAEIKSSTMRRTASIALVFYSIAIYIARVSVNNVGVTAPYRFFWNR